MVHDFERVAVSVFTSVYVLFVRRSKSPRSKPRAPWLKIDIVIKIPSTEMTGWSKYLQKKWQSGHNLIGNEPKIMGWSEPPQFTCLYVCNYYFSTFISALHIYTSVHFNIFNKMIYCTFLHIFGECLSIEGILTLSFLPKGIMTILSFLLRGYFVMFYSNFIISLSVYLNIHVFHVFLPYHQPHDV